MQQIKLMAAGLFLILATGCGSENAGDGSELSAYSDCPGNAICFYNEPNGRGDKCSWREYDQDWLGGGTVCSWSRSQNVKSVINNTPWRIEYFKQAGCSDRVGSTQPGVRGNLAGTYRLRSHRIVR